MINAIPIQLSDPVLIDKALEPLQAVLELRLSWLTKAFGKAQTHKKKQGKKEITYPSIRVGGVEHFSLLPDTHIGNYSFFDVEDGEELMNKSSYASFEAILNLIFFFDLREVYPDDWQTKTVENVKFDILQALKRTSGDFRLNRIYEDAENVFAGFSHNEIESQFTMMPYAALRFKGLFKYHEKGNC
jgi:hypothetical protein